MKRPYLGLGMLAVALIMIGGSRAPAPAPHATRARHGLTPGHHPRPLRRARVLGATYHFMLEHDIPVLGLRRGDFLQVCPDAPVRLGDLVALGSAEGTLTLALYHDEIIDSVAGLVLPCEAPIAA